MKKTLFILLIFSLYVQAQNITITPGGITPVLSGSHPRITYDEILALPSPTIGDEAYDITFLCKRVYNGTRWVCTYQLPNEPIADGSIIASDGGASSDFGRSVVVDVDGNVYVLGHYAGVATFGSVILTSAGGSDIFIAKYNAIGTLQWVQSAGGAGSDHGVAVSLDASGNVYITGYYTETVTFGAVNKTSEGLADIFIAKYNSNGTLQWVESAGGMSNDYGNAVALDGSGNVYITGYYEGTATFGAVSKTSAGSTDIFIAKYNSSGTLQWIQSAGGTSLDNGVDIAVDDLGKVYVTGYYYGAINFGAISTTSAGSADIFIAKYDPVAVEWSWLRSAGGNSDDYGQSLAIDVSGNIYVVGYYEGRATFGLVSEKSVGNSDIFVAKYNASGTLQWLQSAGGESFDYARAVAVDGFGSTYVTGSYHSTATFSTESKTSVGLFDVLIVKYNSEGVFQWLRSAGGVSNEYGNSIALSGDGDVFVTGSYEGKVSFGATSKTSAGGSDVFLLRISQ